MYHNCLFKAPCYQNLCTEKTLDYIINLLTRNVNIIAINVYGYLFYVTLITSQIFSKPFNCILSSSQVVFVSCYTAMFLSKSCNIFSPKVTPTSIYDGLKKV